MKKLQKTLLINWLYYEKQIVTFGDINFLTGKNTSGKSTFIDAMQVVLLGELGGKIFNKAASDTARRTLKSYLRADMDPANARSRKGKSFSSYIACEFRDDVECKSFTCGIVFDCTSDGRETEQFFLYNGPVPQDCFIENHHPLSERALRARLTEQYKTQATFPKSNAQYRDALTAKWNIHTERVFSTLKKAVSFKPITDIRAFITENICDVSDPPDVVEMQQNIREYKHQEQLAAQQEAKQAALDKISEQYRLSNRYLDTYNTHKYLVARAQLQITESAILKLEHELTERKQRIGELKALQETLQQEKEQLTRRRDQLMRAEANSDVAKEQERLMAQKVQMEQEMGLLQERLERAANDIRVEVFQWQTLLRSTVELPPSGEEDFVWPDCQELLTLLGHRAQFRLQDFGGQPEPWLTRLHRKLTNYKDAIYSIHFAQETKRRALQDEYEQNAVRLQKLNQGIKNYPAELLALKQSVEQQLAEKHNSPVKVHILADLLEVSDPRWQGVVEGYMNTQRFYLLVPEEDYPYALAAFKEAKRSQRLHGYGLIDTQRLRQNEKSVLQPNNLAEVVETDNPQALAYIQYLLGRVVRCRNEEQLRNYKVAVTPQGVLYQGYVARHISPALMEDTFIGKWAIEQQKKLLEQAQKKLKIRIEYLDIILTALGKHKDKELLFTARYVDEAGRQLPESYRRLELAQAQCKEVENSLGRLDLTWLMQLKEQIAEVDQLIKTSEGKSSDNATEIGSCKNRVETLEHSDLPEVCQRKLCQEELLEDSFAESFVRNQGEPRYQEELKRLKSAISIARNFGDEGGTLKQSKSAYDESRKQLVYLRRDYVNSHPPCPFQPDRMDNEEFDAELKLLTDIRLPEFREKIRKARESALEQFQNDFLAKLKSNIDSVQQQIWELNKALERCDFGGERYRLMATSHPDYSEYYDMITSPLLMEESGGLFSTPFQSRYGHLIETLFSQIVTADDKEMNARKQSELQANIERFTDYKTYLNFDMETTDVNGNVQLLSQTLNTKSGGETQTPFYIAVLASFAQVYRVNETGSYGNTMRLVVLDEAFNKMDSDRIVESIRLLRKMKLQAIICTPPDKLPDIMPEADKTLLVFKEKYDMQILPWSQELEELLDEA